RGRLGVVAVGVAERADAPWASPPLCPGGLFPFPLAIVSPGPGATLRLSSLLLDLGHEVVGALLQPLADLEADEPAHLDVLAGLGDEVGEQRADVLLP